MSILKNLKNAMGLGDYEDEYYDDEVEDYTEDEVTDRRSISSVFSSRRETREPVRTGYTSQRQEEGKIVSLHNNRTTINIVKPKTFDEAPALAESLKTGQIILINTSLIEKRSAQRLLDFVSGACYALGGDVREVDNGVYVFSPPSIDVEDKGALNGSERGFINWDTYK